MVLYVTGEILLHNNRLETGPVPLAGRGLEVLLHMVGITGVVIILHRIATSRRSRRLNFALLGSYLIVSLMPLSVILIAGGSLFIEVQNGLIEETIEDLESQAENMVLSYMGNSSFKSFSSSRPRPAGTISWLRINTFSIMICPPLI